MQLGYFCSQSSWFSWLHSQQIQIIPAAGFRFEVLLVWRVEVSESPILVVVVVGSMNLVVMYVCVFVVVVFMMVMFMMVGLCLCYWWRWCLVFNILWAGWSYTIGSIIESYYLVEWYTYISIPLTFVALAVHPHHIYNLSFLHWRPGPSEWHRTNTTGPLKFYPSPRNPRKAHFNKKQRKRIDRRPRFGDEV